MMSLGELIEKLSQYPPDSDWYVNLEGKINVVWTDPTHAVHVDEVA